jgi:acyl dehydratase
LTLPSCPATPLKEVNAGDTLYPALEIIDLEEVCDEGGVTTAVTIYNQRSELVPAGQHEYLLKSLTDYAMK